MEECQNRQFFCAGSWEKAKGGIPSLEEPLDLPNRRDYHIGQPWEDCPPGYAGSTGTKSCP